MGTKSKSWVPMKLRYIGEVHALLNGGGGKLSPVGGDPGEMRKQGPSG